MTDRADRDAAQARIDRIDELLDEVEDLEDKIDEKLERVTTLRKEAEDLLGVENSAESAQTQR